LASLAQIFIVLRNANTRSEANKPSPKGRL
jgi:hypothetical protein